jgi:hypothetical protein
MFPAAELVSDAQLRWYELGIRRRQALDLYRCLADHPFPPSLLSTPLTALGVAIDRLPAQAGAARWLEQAASVLERAYEGWQLHQDLPAASGLDDHLAELGVLARHVAERSCVEAPGAAAWLALGEEIARVSWVPAPAQAPGERPTCEACGGERGSWQWEDPRRLQELLDHLDVPLEQLFPEGAPDVAGSLPDLPDHEGFWSWYVLEAGLERLRQAARPTTGPRARKGRGGVARGGPEAPPADGPAPALH